MRDANQCIKAAYDPVLNALRISGGGTAPQTVAPVAGAAAVSLSGGGVFYVLLDANTTLTLTDPTDGARYTFILEQGGTGSYTITFSPVPLLAGGTAIDLTDAVGSVDVVTLIYSAALGEYLGAAVLDFT